MVRGTLGKELYSEYVLGITIRDGDSGSPQVRDLSLYQFSSLFLSPFLTPFVQYDLPLYPSWVLVLRVLSSPEGPLFPPTRLRPFYLSLVRSFPSPVNTVSSVSHISRTLLVVVSRNPFNVCLVIPTSRLVVFPTRPVFWCPPVTGEVYRIIRSYPLNLVGLFGTSRKLVGKPSSFFLPNRSPFYPLFSWVIFRQLH